jgi:hypothetical protein|tara:strand:- start:272 stop:907 length:636 start_codon:yes stop_codon:yes gene_type:complete
MGKKLYYDSGKPIKVKGVGEFTGISDKALKEAAKKQRIAATKTRVKARKSLIVKTVDPKTLPKAGAGKGVNVLANVTPGTQSVAKGNPVKSGSGGVPKGTRQTSFLKTFPADKTTDFVKAGEKTFKSGIQSKAVAEKFAQQSTNKYMQSVIGKKAAAKLVAKTASKFIPVVGPVVMAYDAYQLLSSIPKSKKKKSPIELYGQKMDTYGYKY